MGQTSSEIMVTKQRYLKTIEAQEHKSQLKKKRPALFRNNLNLSLFKTEKKTDNIVATSRHIPCIEEKQYSQSKRWSLRNIKTQLRFKTSLDKQQTKETKLNPVVVVINSPDEITYNEDTSSLPDIDKMTFINEPDIKAMILTNKSQLYKDLDTLTRPSSTIIFSDDCKDAQERMLATNSTLCGLSEDRKYCCACFAGYNSIGTASSKNKLRLEQSKSGTTKKSVNFMKKDDADDNILWRPPSVEEQTIIDSNDQDEGETLNSMRIPSSFGATNRHLRKNGVLDVDAVKEMISNKNEVKKKSTIRSVIHKLSFNTAKQTYRRTNITELLGCVDAATHAQASVCEMQILPDGLLESDIDFNDLGLESGVYGPGIDSDTVPWDMLQRRVCKKNPGHIKFVPLTEFDPAHLPEAVRCKHIWKIIQDQSLRTVKLTVYYTTDRPHKYDVGVRAGSTRGRFGTGWLELFDKTIQQIPGYVYGRTFVILTAAHVIFDKKEVKETKVEFFFVDDRDKSNVIEAKGIKLILVNNSLDVCRFMCTTKNDQQGAEILKRLKQVPTSYSPLPAIENVAWCVSHPHGMAQRVTVGRVKEIVEDEPAWSCNVLKLLVYQCVTQFGIGEKQIFYIFFKDSVNGINLYLPNNLDKTTALEYKLAFLEHLTSKNLVENANPRDSGIIKTEYNNLIQYLNEERDAVLADKYAVNPNVLSPARYKEEKHYYFKHVVNEIASWVTVTSRFQGMFNEVEKELWLKKHELFFGTNNKEVDLARTKSIVYDLDSCPGSSGARVTAYLLTSEGLRRYMGQHSRGLKENQGNMCGGGGSRLVPFSYDSCDEIGADHKYKRVLEAN